LLPSSLTEAITSQFPSVKTCKYTIEKAAKGYVRVTVHGDDINLLIEDWEKVHGMLESLGEKVERVQQEYNRSHDNEINFLTAWSNQ
jgi:DNA-directed RNA polymerase subunit L